MVLFEGCPGCVHSPRASPIHPTGPARVLLVRWSVNLRPRAPRLLAGADVDGRSGPSVLGEALSACRNAGRAWREARNRLSAGLANLGCRLSRLRPSSCRPGRRSQAGDRRLRGIMRRSGGERPVPTAAPALVIPTTWLTSSGLAHCRPAVRPVSTCVVGIGAGVLVAGWAAHGIPASSPLRRSPCSLILYSGSRSEPPDVVAVELRSWPPLDSAHC